MMVGVSRGSAIRSLLLVAISFAAICQSAPPSIAPAKILETYNHDTDAFTQGLVFFNNTMFESTGMYGASTFRQVNYTTGNVIKSLSIDRTYFAEGLVEFNDLFYQLTWQNKIGFIYDTTMTRVGQWTYPTEGWGITHNRTHMFLSDGSSTIYVIDPKTMSTIATIPVTEQVSSGQRNAVRNLNELEYIDGYIWANVWLTTRIVIIDPLTGYVVHVVTVDELKRQSGGDVANGIAYNPVTNNLYLTGKYWSKLFQIEYPKFVSKRQQIHHHL